VATHFWGDFGLFAKVVHCIEPTPPYTYGLARQGGHRLWQREYNPTEQNRGETSCMAFGKANRRACYPRRSTLAVVQDSICAVVSPPRAIPYTQARKSMGQEIAVWILAVGGCCEYDEPIFSLKLARRILK
jgi:hypothetical protein